MAAEHRRLSPGATAILLAFLTTGCTGGPGDQPDLGKVTGTVRLDGSPLADAYLRFQPESGRPSTAKTDDSGVYELNYTYKVKGAKVGPHTVRIWTFETGSDPDTGKLTILAKERVPVSYNAETTLRKDVAPGAQVIDFNLDSSFGKIIQRPPSWQ